MNSPTLDKVKKLLCWIGIHKRAGWKTDYGTAYTPALSIIAPHLGRIKRYRQFNRCERCGDVKCQFTQP